MSSRLTKALVFAVLLPALLMFGQTQTPPPQVPSISSSPPGTTFGKFDGATPLQSAEYIIGSGDLLTISIYGDPDLSRDQRVGVDGSIWMPLLKEKIKAGGKSLEQLQDTISKAYISQGILKSPQPLVTVKEYHSAPVRLVGSFVQPSVIQIVGRTSLLEAISQGHGLTPTAGPKIIVSRHEGGSIQTFTIPVKDLYERTDDPALNVEIKVGDTISVPRSEFIYVSGAVSKPGMLPMNEVSDWTVLKALTAVGNTLRTAKKDQCVIMRTTGVGAKQEIPVNLSRLLSRKDADIPLMANDMLLIPDSTGLRALYRATDAAISLGTGLAIVVAPR